MKEDFYDKKHHGFYRGIIIQNNDPERRGRCKVFVPDFFPQLYDNWVGDVDVDKLVRFPAGQNLDPATKKIFERLKEVEPWAEQASPLFGSGTAGLYSFNDDFATISQSSFPDGRLPGTGGDGSAEPNQNLDNIGESPGRALETEEYRVNDGFRSLQTDRVPRTNAYAYNYKPTTHSNKVQGAFSVPNVGAHVWVFFEGGNPQRPVYFAFSYGRRDWQDIYEIGPDLGKDYPGSYENDESPDALKRYRDKWTMTMKGGGLEIVNTDGGEAVNMSHHSGSFKEMNNSANIELATKQDQKLVQLDQFLTVKGDQNIHVGKGQHVNIDRTRITRIGTTQYAAAERWKGKYRDIAELRALFTIRRAEQIAMRNGEVIPRTSPAQKQEGEFAPNPNVDQQIFNTEFPVKLEDLSTVPVRSAAIDEVSDYATPELLDITAIMGVDSQDETLGEPKVYPTVDTYLESAGEPGAQNFTRPDQNPELSASTKDGAWVAETIREEVGRLETERAQELAEIERELGVGGDDIHEVSRHYHLTVGSAFNDYPAVRCDGRGKMSVHEVLIDEAGTYAHQKESPLVERVANDSKFPVGNFTLTIGNKMKANVGSGGIGLKTTGVAEFGGVTTAIAGREQIDLASKGDINLKAGRRIVLEADGVVLKSKEDKQLAIDGSLGVKNNLVVAGSMMSDGEMYVQHITAPVEIQETEEVKLFGFPVAGAHIGNAIIGSGSSAGTWPVLGVATPDSLEMYDHSHHFKNVPLTLMQSHNEVRKAAAPLNRFGVRVPAKTPDHVRKKILTAEASPQDTALRNFVEERFAEREQA